MINITTNFLVNFLLLFLPLSVFIIGIVGLIVFRKNLILLLISLEMLLLSVNLNFLLTSLFIDDIEGYILNLFILGVAGSEISIGLALIILLYRIRSLIFIDSITYLKS